MDTKTYLVLAQYREGSDYDDRIGHQYHFPRKYFNQLTLPDIEFIYFEPKRAGKGEYFGYGQIGKVYPDIQKPDQFFAEILNYRPFSNPVPALDDQGQPREIGPSYNPQNAVRKTSTEIFMTICREGGVDLDSLGVESENSESNEPITDPFDPSKVKVDREPMSIFQVLRKMSLDEIILNPDFQRNLVWDPMRRSRLIESILLRIPLPAFYLDGVEANRWIVIDGLQRLSTLEDFVTKQRFTLYGLEYLTSIEGRTFAELPRGMQRDIEETQVTLFIIRPETPPEVKFTIFYRINTGGLVLTPQEIRHALFQGQATKLLQALSEIDEFKDATENSISDTRMDARECILRYLAFHIHAYTTYSKADLNSFLSKSMKDINALSSVKIKVLTDDFRDAMVRAQRILGRYAFRKFTMGAGRRGPINKALFESWTNVLQDYDPEALFSNREKILLKLSDMLSSDLEYERSLSTGTGSIRSVQARFKGAHRAIQEALQ